MDMHGEIIDGAWYLNPDGTYKDTEGVIPRALQKEHHSATYFGPKAISVDEYAEYNEDMNKKLMIWQFIKKLKENTDDYQKYFSLTLNTNVKDADGKEIKLHIPDDIVLQLLEFLEDSNKYIHF